jgi:LacI family transcriptional regulator
MNQQPKKIAVLIEAIRGHDRKLLKGISKYARTQGNWIFYLDKLDPFYKYKSSKENDLTSKLLKWGVDGVITRYPEKVFELEKRGIPIVQAIQTDSADLAGKNIIEIANNEIGRFGAEHLLDRGFRHFGFCGLEEMFWSKQRSASFGQRVSEAGYNVSYYKQPKKLKNLYWEVEQVAITQWLKSLHRPTGIMACNDDRAEHVIECCKLADLNIPEDVAVIGADNDELICEFSNPPLSSVSINSENGGFEAAEMLDNIMHGRPVSQKKIIIRPLEVVTRQSTDILAIEDDDVAQAIAIIRRHSKAMIQVEEIADHVGIGLRVLQTRFRKVLGRSLREELKRVRLNEITNLLRHTKLTVSQIASQLGYGSDHNMARFFYKELKMSPQQYRKNNC